MRWEKNLQEWGGEGDKRGKGREKNWGKKTEGEKRKGKKKKKKKKKTIGDRENARISISNPLLKGVT